MSFRSLVAIILFLSLGAAPAAAAQPVTVGDFAVRLARSLGYTVATPAEARTRLAGIGLAVPGDSASPLTEGGGARVRPGARSSHRPER
jgi:hypothetical protein